MRKILVLFIAMLTVLASLSACNQETPGERLLREAETAYNEALSLIEQGKYEEARNKLHECIGYKDTEEILSCFVVKYRVEITERTFYHSYDESVSVLNQHQEYVYNRYGKPTLINYFADDGSLYSYDEVEYDEFGHMIAQLRYQPDGTLLKSFLRAYNTNGDLTLNEEIDHLSSYNSYRYDYIYEYYENGLMKSKATYINENLLKTESWEYDSSGNKTVYSIADGSGTLTDRERYSYEFDEDGRITNLTAKNSLGSLAYTYSYTYDDKGNVKTENYHCLNGNVPYKYKFVYDGDNNLIQKWRYDSSGKLNRKQVYEYNEYHDPTLEVIYDGDGNKESVIVYTYKDPVLYYDPFLK